MEPTAIINVHAHVHREATSGELAISGMPVSRYVEHCRSMGVRYACVSAALIAGEPDCNRLARECFEHHPDALIGMAFIRLGKDAPGSPITDAAVFPEDGLAWDFNYRGDLVFLRQAWSQQPGRRLHVEDGWTYFVIGWLAVIGEVFGRAIPLRGQFFDGLRRIAEAERR